MKYTLSSFYISTLLFTFTTCSMRSETAYFFDTFDYIDQQKWTINENTFPACGSTMMRQSVTVDSSVLTITIDQKDSINDNRDYRGGEIGSNTFMNYGTFTVRMKNDIAAGTVSSFFLMNKWKENEWEHKEIDIEFLGKDPTKVQFTVHHYQNGGRDHVNYIKTHDLGFDSSEDFNEYGIHWAKDSICWLVNGTIAHTETQIVPDTLMQLRMNHWMVGEQKEWLGEVDFDAIPSKVHYDWIKYEPIDKYRN